MCHMSHKHYFTAGLYSRSIAETHGSLIPSPPPTPPPPLPRDKTGAHGYAAITACLQRRINGCTCEVAAAITQFTGCVVCFA